MSTEFRFGAPWVMSSSSSSSKSGGFCFPSSPSPSPFSLSSSSSPFSLPSSPSPQFSSCFSSSGSISTNPGTGLPLGTPSSSSSSSYLFGASPNPSFIFPSSSSSSTSTTTNLFSGSSSSAFPFSVHTTTTAFAPSAATLSPNPNPNPNPSFGAASGLASTPFSLNTSSSSSSSASSTLFGSSLSFPSPAPAPPFGTSFLSSSAPLLGGGLRSTPASSFPLFGSPSLPSAATPSLSTTSSSSLFGAVSVATTTATSSATPTPSFPSLSVTSSTIPILLPGFGNAASSAAPSTKPISLPQFGWTTTTTAPAQSATPEVSATTSVAAPPAATTPLFPSQPSTSAASKPSATLFESAPLGSSTTAAAMPTLTASTTLTSTTAASITSAFSGFALPSPCAPAATTVTSTTLAPASTSSLFQSTSASLLFEPVPERPTPLLTVTANAEAAPTAGKVRVKLEEGEIASDAQAVRVEPLAKGSISVTTSKAATVVSPTGGDDEWSLSDERDRPEAEPEVPATHALSLPPVKVESSHSTDTEGANRGESRMESARSLAKGPTESTNIQCLNDLAGDAPIQRVVRMRIEETIALRLNRIVVPVIPASQVFEDNRGIGKRMIQRLLKSAFANNGIPSFDDFADRVSGFLTGLASLDIDPAPHAQVLIDLCKKLIGLEVISAARDRITHPTEASKLEGLRASLNEAKKKLTTVERTTITLKAEHEQIKTGICVTREMIQKMEETLAEVRSRLAEARSRLAKQEEDEKIIETDIASLEQEAIIKYGRVNILHSQYAQTQDLVDRLAQEHAFLDCVYSDEMRQVSDMAGQLL